MYDFAAADVATMRKAEDERYAYFVEAAVVDLDLPDAVHRGYEGDEALLGRPFEDDEPPIDILRREILRLEPQHVYFPIGRRRPRRSSPLPGRRPVAARRG